MAVVSGKGTVFLTALAVFAGLALARAEPALADGKRAVLELFTSQGCSSCPPADALIEEFAKEDDILALSYAVDYWDYLGWKDTLASSENTKRQYSYASRRGDRSVYTPQVVINGREHEVGSDRRAITKSIKRQERKFGGAMDVDVSLSIAKDKITVSLDPAKQDLKPGKARVWLVFYESAKTVAIGRGENRGRTITYTNVVRDLVPLGTWTGEPTTLTVERSKAHGGGDADHCAVIVQRDEGGFPGAIIGASNAVLMAGS